MCRTQHPLVQGCEEISIRHLSGALHGTIQDPMAHCAGHVHSELPAKARVAFLVPANPKIGSCSIFAAAAFDLTGPGTHGPPSSFAYIPRDVQGIDLAHPRIVCSIPPCVMPVTFPEVSDWLHRRAVCNIPSAVRTARAETSASATSSASTRRGHLMNSLTNARKQSQDHRAPGGSTA